MIEKIIENEWKNKDKNYFLSKLYEWIWNYLNRINQMCANQSKFYINNNSPYIMQILNEINSGILFLSSIGKYCDLFSFLKNNKNRLFSNDQNYNNIKIQKIIYILTIFKLKNVCIIHIMM